MLHLSCRWDQEVKHVALQGPWPCWFCTNHVLCDLNHLFNLFNCIFRAECGSQEIVYNSADLHKRPKFSSLCLLCDVLEVARMEGANGGMEKSDLSGGRTQNGEEAGAWQCQPAKYKVPSHMVSL